MGVLVKRRQMRWNLLAVLALAFLSAGGASAQVRVVGRVIEAESERPIPGAEIVFRTPEGQWAGRTVTDADGRFSTVMKPSRTAGVRIRADRIGYRQNITPVLYFDNRLFYQVEIRLDQDAVLLAPLEVLARSGREQSHFLDSFRFRSQHGNGYYLTREQIEAQHPSLVTDLLRTVPGLEVASGGGAGNRPIVQTARGAARGCDAQVYVDGLLVNRRVTTSEGPRTDIFRIDDVVSPDAVEGIEVYLGLSTIPPEFLSPEASCGVVAIWTRRGDR